MPRHDTLWQRLESARTAELHKLAQIVGLPDAERQTDTQLVEKLSKAIRSAAGHSFRNLFRHDHDFPYKQMLIDVADKMAPGWTPWSWTKYRLHDEHSEIQIEETIWQFYEDRLRQVLANTASGLKYLRHVLPLLRHPPVVVGVGVFLLVASPFLFYYLGNTAYRKTVPAAVQLIYIRKLRELEDSLE